MHVVCDVQISKLCKNDLFTAQIETFPFSSFYAMKKIKREFANIAGRVLIKFNFGQS